MVVEDLLNSCANQIEIVRISNMAGVIFESFYEPLMVKPFEDELILQKKVLSFILRDKCMEGRTYSN
jgi:hypothetical protein